jgi:hypothetical protein
MAYTTTQTFENNPNIGAASPFVSQNSNQADLFANVAAHGGGSMGVGSFKIRSIDDAIKLYRPYDTAVTAMIRMLGGSDTVNNVVHEWAEDDELMPFDIEGKSAPTNANTVVNNVTGGSPYSPAPTGTFELQTGDGAKVRINRKVRYHDTDGGYTYAVVTAISGDTITLAALTGDLKRANANTASAQVLDAAYGSDLNYDPAPMGANPKMYFTYLQQIIGFAKYTERSTNEANIFDQRQRAMQQAMSDFNRQLETNTLYGIRARRELVANQDYQYFSEGVHDTTKAQNYHTSDLTTGGNFDATKFKNAMYSFVKYNFGAESGGPKMRQMFIDGNFSNYLDRAFEDKQRFQGNTFAGGVMVSRFEISDGIVDFVRNPFFEIQHPIPAASLRQAGTSRAYGLLLPVTEDTLTRLTFNGEGIRDDDYKVKGGDVETVYRIRATYGTKHCLRQYAAVFEEVAA